ncbi:ankyrin repeat protein [Trichuris trichiura]|uniref:Ankyrin repeat protein n=1 Tax=Trichuris trichiura TaxID=36087 RepID=A0A077ZCR0_TRITR|nr:ankyrin repeat protein [Trichuris trichiura]
MRLAEEAMYRSIVNGDVQGVEQLLTNHHVDPDLRYYSYSIPALNFAIMREQHEIARIFLLHGASVNQTDCEQRKSALHCAVSTRNLATVKMLLQERANPNLRDLNGSTPVHLAARLGAFDIFLALLDSGGNAEARDGNCRTPLLVACTHGNLQIINCLLNKNVDVTVHDFDYNTALHLYRRFPLSLCKRLLSMGTCVNSLNSFGQSPLFLYVHWLSTDDFGSSDIDCYRCLYWLLLNGAEPNQLCLYYLRSPLAVAICNEDVIAVSMLLSFGADPHLVDSLGRTPGSLAVRTKNIQILQQLYYHGMNANLWTEYIAPAKCVMDQCNTRSASDALNKVLTGEVQCVRSLQFISALALRRSLDRNADKILFDSNLPFHIKNKLISLAYYVFFAMTH